MSKSVSSNDKIGWCFENTYISLPEIMLTKIKPVSVKEPKTILINKKLFKYLGLNFTGIDENYISSIFSGNLLPENSECIAQAYAGHQFGHFTNLGDGRAITIGEHITKKNKRFDIQFKGSGKTPYSRGGDGRAALGPMIREYIISEAMHHLGIPTTRSLAVVKTGETVMRETPLEGAILTRVASSHIRVGTFQYVAMLGERKNLKALLNYTIERHYPEIKNSKNPALSLLEFVIKKQIKLITNWMRVGFVHGVMNTDNMTISGETIDYGPCAFMDTYNPETVFSSIDSFGRYSYFNQPMIAKWNLARFAETLLPLINDKNEKALEEAKNLVDNFDDLYKESWTNMMIKKIGLDKKKMGDENLIEELLNIMHQNKLDFTRTFCSLLEKNIFKNKIYQIKELFSWYEKWKKRQEGNNFKIDESIDIMKFSNPRIIPRNHQVEEVLKEAEKNNLKPLNDFLSAIEKPYEFNDKHVKYEIPPPFNNEKYKTFCGT